MRYSCSGKDNKDRDGVVDVVPVHVPPASLGRYVVARSVPLLGQGYLDYTDTGPLSGGPSGECASGSSRPRRGPPGATTLRPSGPSPPRASSMPTAGARLPRVCRDRRGGPTPSRPASGPGTSRGATPLCPSATLPGWVEDGSRRPEGRSRVGRGDVTTPPSVPARGSQGRRVSCLRYRKLRRSTDSGRLGPDVSSSLRRVARGGRGLTVHLVHGSPSARSRDSSLPESRLRDMGGRGPGRQVTGTSPRGVWEDGIPVEKKNQCWSCSNLSFSIVQPADR